MCIRDRSGVRVSRTMPSCPGHQGGPGLRTAGTGAVRRNPLSGPARGRDIVTAIVGIAQANPTTGGVMKTRLGLGTVVIGVLAAVVVSAQFGGRPPSGSYSRTCNNEELIGSVLTAECKDQNGETIKTRLYVRDCSGDI